MRRNKKFTVKANQSIRRNRKITASTTFEFDKLMREIADSITDEVSVDSNDDLDDAIREQLDYEIERACTYYSDCLNIIQWSRMFDWSDAGYDLTTIEQVAAYAIETEFYENYYDAVYAFLEKGEV